VAVDRDEQGVPGADSIRFPVSLADDVLDQLTIQHFLPVLFDWRR
jgi:hypothetical protein